MRSSSTGDAGSTPSVVAEAGFPVEVVPGITSSVAAPAAAGIPVTHRGLSAAFTVVTGHRQPGETPVDWRSLARVGGSIVVLMGVAHRAEIAAELIAGGLPHDTPVAAIHRATTPEQTVARTTLAGLGQTPVESPSVLVIGAVAGLDVTENAIWAASVPHG